MPGQPHEMLLRQELLAYVVEFAVIFDSIARHSNLKEATAYLAMVLPAGNM